MGFRRRRRFYGTPSYRTKKIEKSAVCSNCKKLMPAGTFVEFKTEGSHVWHKYKSDCRAKTDSESYNQMVIDDDIYKMHSNFLHRLQTNESLKIDKIHNAESVIDLYSRLIDRLKWSAGKKASTSVWLALLGCLFGTHFDTFDKEKYTQSDADGRHTTTFGDYIDQYGIRESFEDTNIAKVVVVLDAERGFPKRVVIGTINHDGTRNVVKRYNF